MQSTRGNGPHGTPRCILMRVKNVRGEKGVVEGEVTGRCHLLMRKRTVYHSMRRSRGAAPDARRRRTNPTEAARPTLDMVLRLRTTTPRRRSTDSRS